MSLIIFSHRTGRILNLSSSSVHYADRNTNCYEFPALKDCDSKLFCARWVRVNERRKEGVF